MRISLLLYILKEAHNPICMHLQTELHHPWPAHYWAWLQLQHLSRSNLKKKWRVVPNTCHGHAYSNVTTVFYNITLKILTPRPFLSLCVIKKWYYKHSKTTSRRCKSCRNGKHSNSEFSCLLSDITDFGTSPIFGLRILRQIILNLTTVRI